MTPIADRIPPRAVNIMIRTLYALPAPIRRAIAGRPVRHDGQQLDLNVQLLLRLTSLASVPLDQGSAGEGRRQYQRLTASMARTPTDHVRARDTHIPGRAHDIPARLYTPTDKTGFSGLLIYFHGGGWVIGDIASHDPVCRYLSSRAGVRVLSVDYRLAPEHPFPAALEDATAAYEHVLSHAPAFGTDPSAVAVGGDSAGANLAAVVSANASRGTKPRFTLMLYPVTDVLTRYRSQDLFERGYLLSDGDMSWFIRNYLTDEQLADPRATVLLHEDLTHFPATYLATAGFDVLRDEGEAFASRLAEAGVAVELHRQADLIHGYAHMVELGGRPREALAEAADALRTGLTSARTAAAADN